eukprot:c989_g1_i2 orf=284-1903(-)
MRTPSESRHFRLRICIILIIWPAFALPLPLATNSRWIVDEADGSRVKLACMNWVSHLQPMVAEGLSKQPLDTITSTIRAMGFNCVRLTWATFMFTNSSLGQQTVSQSFTSLNLIHALSGIVKNNPDLVALPVVEVFQTVVSSLGKNGLLIVLDNHISKPEWCCSNTDGNGFWGDTYFDPDVWAEGLRIVASLFKDSPQVVAMSMRNELRGPRENIADWYKYVQIGAETIHDANPNVLIIHSGLNFDSDLSFLRSRQLNPSFKNKVVYEMHWYAFTNGNAFGSGNLNQVCESITSSVVNKAAYLVMPNTSFSGPLFVSEFGIDETGANRNDNRYISCIFALIARWDMDWAYWTLQGSYYIRNNQQDLEEIYGILNSGWDSPRNLSFLNRLQSLQRPFIQDISASPNAQKQIIFHPQSGLCLQKDKDNALSLGSCGDATYWTFNSQGQITEMSTYFCIGAEAAGQPAVIRVQGTEKNGPWQLDSQTDMQFSTQLGNLTVCLDGQSHAAVLTSACICAYNSGCTSADDPSGQWFKFVPTSSS